ncbi:MAG: GGDEF domain-containing protein [Syntrophotaleaceae bacterium]
MTDSLVILKKPFDIAEVLQLTHALTRKWELHRQIQGRLHQLAYFDSLTGLPNRTQFLNSPTKNLSNSQKNKKKAALLYIDLDDFKRINDTLGHSLGDDLLKIIAHRLASCIRDSDLVGEMSQDYKTARLGGDEFTVLLPDIESEGRPAVARRTSNSLAQSVDLGQHQVLVTPADLHRFAPGDGEDADTLMKNADMAMYFAKRNGPQKYQFFQESMNADALEKIDRRNTIAATAAAGRIPTLFISRKLI